MRELPILFSGPMVRAILEGRKTQTRRMVKASQFPGKFHARCLAVGVSQTLREMYFEGRFDERPFPHGAVGDRLWVRETWAAYTPQDYFTGECDEIACAPAGMPERYGTTRSDVVYQADGKSSPYRWRPSIHMPRWASRILLEVTGVRVERLWDIAEEDARAEGVDRANGHPDRGSLLGTGPCFREGFAQAWVDLYGAESWSVSPWVWVVEFRRIEGASHAA